MRKSLLITLPALIVVLFVLNLMAGAVRIPLANVGAILVGEDGVRASWRYIVLESRLPQGVTAMLCGAALAVSGLMLQTAFRNPLAGPSVFGITSGAALGVAVVMLLLGGSVSIGMLDLSGFLAVWVSAFAGAMAVTGIIFLFSSLVRNGVMLLIVGLMIGYLSASAMSLLNFFATEEGVKSYIMWGMGDFGSVSMGQLPVFVAVIMAGLLASLAMIKPLNALLLGEEYAENLGVNTIRVRNQLLVITGVLTATTTAFCGPVAFIGLAVPHVTRLVLATENHRLLLPATVVVGAATALLCNLICSLPADGAIPLNAVTPLIGAPIIIYVIVKGRFQ
ncbi:iron ABC transporter permease [Hoylesella enoeca]|uniref:Iron ABC transporter n=1 Tax=Hoylesella enoeca TaxID=76123 RepID=A0A0S2KNL6_9BACT|nr:iron ABC transporter permease [Hoylesella enoeca]ALO49894.1 iron ABC transporter [Hoylesella enoeca]